MDQPTLSASVALDTQSLRQEVGKISSLASGMGTALTGAFRSAIIEGDSLGEVLRNLAVRISDLALSAALKPVEGFLGGIIQRGIGAGASASGAAVARPGYFPTGTGLGLTVDPAAGATAMPVRGSTGRSTPTTLALPAQVTVNISTPDVESFRRSESQVSSALARAVDRGRRGL
jgi:hypothetical protein